MQQYHNNMNSAGCQLLLGAAWHEFSKLQDQIKVHGCRPQLLYVKAMHCC